MRWGKNPMISIVIVNWNGCELLKKCINSIYKTSTTSHYEIIVVDNASTDNSVCMIKEQFKNVILIENKKNEGFAKATNMGIKRSKGSIILLLNSDVELKELNTLNKVEKFLSEHQEIGILGPNLIFPNGIPQAPGGKFISNWQLFKTHVLFMRSPIFYQLRSKFLSNTPKEFYDIDYVSGACLFVKKIVLEEIGFLEENFFMYGEDMEFCYRAKMHGWRNVILPTIDVIHLKGQSTKKNLDQILKHSIKNNYFLIQKFYGKNKIMITHLIYQIGLAFRFILSWISKSGTSTSYLKLMTYNNEIYSTYSVKK